MLDGPGRDEICSAEKTSSAVESVESPWQLAHRLRASHPDSEGVENVWNDEEKTTEGVVTTVGQRTCPRGASEGGNVSGGGSDARVVEGDPVPQLR